MTRDDNQGIKYGVTNVTLRISKRRKDPSMSISILLVLATLYLMRCILLS